MVEYFWNFIKQILCNFSQARNNFY